jgi:hypothetical protein
MNQYLLGRGSFQIVLVFKCELSLCQTPIKSDLLGFSRISFLACELLDRMIKGLHQEWEKTCNDAYESESVITLTFKTMLIWIQGYNKKKQY